MGNTWWDLGEHSGYSGVELATYRIDCPFCDDRGHFETVASHKKVRPSDKKTLNYDTLKCTNCSNLIMVFWSAGDRIHDYKTVPWRIEITQAPTSWPAEVGRFWLQATRSIAASNWDAAALMARSALQAVMRDKEAKGKNLKEEIDHLAAEGLLPKVMNDWAHELRLLANTAAHPAPGDPQPTAQDVKLAMSFLNLLLRYLYDLPQSIEQFRKDKV